MMKNFFKQLRIHPRLSLSANRVRTLFSAMTIALVSSGAVTQIQNFAAFESSWVDSLQSLYFQFIWALRLILYLLWMNLDLVLGLGWVHSEYPQQFYSTLTFSYLLSLFDHDRNRDDPQLQTLARKAHNFEFCPTYENFKNV